MTDMQAKRRAETAQEMQAAIMAIMKKRRIAASRSLYDRKVCVRAVGAAGDAIDRVPVEGTVIEYGEAVVAVLGDLQDTYNDSDGEYTSGKGPIGDVYFDIRHLLDTQRPDELGDTNKKEARRVIIGEMVELAHSISRSPGDNATISFEAQGPSGTPYFLEVTFEASSDREFTMLGKIFTDDSRQRLILEEKLELIADDDD